MCLHGTILFLYLTQDEDAPPYAFASLSKAEVLRVDNVSRRLVLRGRSDEAKPPPPVRKPTVFMLRHGSSGKHLQGAEGSRDSRGRVPLVAHLCDAAGAALCSQQDELGRTALHYCASKGFLNRFETVLDCAGDHAQREALVLSADNQGYTVGSLALACSPQMLEEIREIVKRKISSECAAKLGAPI